MPGQSIACGGPYGCASFQVCSASGSAYGPCDCPEGGSSGYYDDGGLRDGYAPLPPPVGDQGYNAIWAPGVETPSLFLPLYSAPDCRVVPPYGESYVVDFQPTGTGPSGTLSACPGTPGSAPCYMPGISVGTGFSAENVPGGVYTLSTFNANGIATGQMNTSEGIVPLIVKNCQ